MSYPSIPLCAAAVVLPCLTLHRDDDLEKKAEIPDHLACPFNMRKLNTINLGENCINKENLVDTLRKEKKDCVPSVLSGDHHLIFTSYETSHNTSKDTSTTIDHAFIMQSTLTEGVVNLNSFCYVTNLTKETITAGIQWLQGDASPDNFNSTNDALVAYLETLKQVIPLQKPLGGGLKEMTRGDILSAYISDNHVYMRDAYKFIECRDWPDSDEKEMVLGKLKEYGGLLDDDVNFRIKVTSFRHEDRKFREMCSLARRFIYKNVAKQTKVIVHVVDGTHRLTALECALISYKSSDDTPLHHYHLRLPHAEKKLSITAILPTDAELTSNFVDQMKCLSSQCQTSFGSLHPHGKKQFFAAMIEDLDVECKKKFPKRPFFMSSAENEEANLTITPALIGDFANMIIKIICHKKYTQNYHMVPGMYLSEMVKKNVECWTHLFKKKIPGRDNYGDYTFLWDDGKLTVQHFISHCGGDIHSENRYSRMGLNSQTFELAQILMFTRISLESYKQVLDCFTTNPISSSIVQISAHDKKGTLTNQWISGLVDTIGTSVYYSFHVYKKIKVTIHNEELLMRLIKSAIKGTTEFFTEYGLHPNPPDWFNVVPQKMIDKVGITTVLGEIFEKRGIVDEEEKAILQDKIKKKYIPTIQDNFISFIRVSFALDLHKRLMITTKGKSKLTDLIELGISKDHFLGKKPSQITTIETSDITHERKWTGCIKEYATDIAPHIYTHDCNGQIAQVTRHYLDSIIKTKKKKIDTENNDTEEKVALKKPALAEYQSIKTVIEHLKQHDFISYLEKKIQFDNGVNHETKHKAKRLLGLIKEFPIEMLEECYVTGRDLEEGRDDDENDDGESVMS